MTLLLALRIHGPIELPDLAGKIGARAGLNEAQTDDLLLQIIDEIEELCDAGLAFPYFRYEWSCTEKGCRVVDGHEGIEASAPHRDGARECVGVGR